MIIRYGIDGYPSIAILLYDGENIVYTVRYINDDIRYLTFCGTTIKTRIRKFNQRLIKDYFLVTLDNKEIEVFNENLGEVFS